MHEHLPSATALAHAIRFGTQTAAELAREYGVSHQTVCGRLGAGGFDVHGERRHGEPEPDRPKPRLKDADTGAGHHVGGADARLPTGPVVYGPPPERHGFDWGDGPSTPARVPRDPLFLRREPDPDEYTEPPVGEWEPDAEAPIEAEFEEESTRDGALTCTLPKSGTSPEAAAEPDQNLDSRNQSDDGHLTEQASQVGNLPTSADATQMRPRAADEQANKQATCSGKNPEKSPDRLSDHAPQCGAAPHRVAPRGGRKLGPHTTEIVRRYTDGESSPQIAKDYGCTPAAVTALLHREGVHVRTRAEGQQLRLGNQSPGGPATDGTKTCVRCAKTKPVDEFPEHDDSSDGRAGACRDCLNKRPPTETRAIRNRARNRAYTALAAAHRAEWEQLVEAKTVEVTREFDRIREAAGKDGDPVPRLKPGPKRRSQSDVVERIDVARCRTCHTHHDVNHVCPTCGDDTPEQAPEVPAYEMRAWARAEGMAPVPPNGPLPARIVDAYEQAHAPAQTGVGS